VKRGAKAAVGFHNEGPSWDYNAHWKWAFWFWQAMKNGRTVEDALVEARDKVAIWARKEVMPRFPPKVRKIWEKYKWYYFYTENFEIFGDKNWRIVPPPQN
jgi:hypothetical protein